MMTAPCETLPSPLLIVTAAAPLAVPGGIW
jgi:hypothetical protein